MHNTSDDDKSGHKGEPSSGGDDKSGGKLVLIAIDGEEHRVADRGWTADELLVLAGVAATQHYLVEIKGKKQESYQGRGSAVLHLQKGDAFVTVFTGPTTVSDVGAACGPALFKAGLEGMGHEVIDVGGGNLQFSYPVEVGRFQGTTFTLGLLVPPDFPFTPPSGPHVCPHVHPLQSGGAHPAGGIHSSPGYSGFGAEFQYWSRPFPGWTGTGRRASDYMAFIRGLWATQ